MDRKLIEISPQLHLALKKRADRKGVKLRSVTDKVIRAGMRVTK